ncbi:MAG TPA: hypothetical protein VL916_15565, partial [Ilumatobacteraceae bacterium]|nr:hypothetical protein [Ilumatobacteraceae bacterium]
DDIRSVLEQIATAGGEWSGEYTVDSHEVLADADVQGFGTRDLMVVRVDSAYATGPVEIVLTFVDIDGHLRLLGFDVTPA